MQIVDYIVSLRLGFLESTLSVRVLGVRAFPA